MKRIVSLLLAATLLSFALCISASANLADGLSTDYIQNTTNAYDLQAYGVHTFSSYKVSVKPEPDGIIGTGEYPGVSDVAVIGDGLWLTNSTGATDYTEQYGSQYSDFTLKTYLAYDEEFAYIAEEVTSANEISVITAGGATSTISTSVRYGLNQSPYLTDASSRLSNSYSYKPSGNNFVVSSCTSGNRNFKQVNGAVNQTIILDEDAYNDGETTWDRMEYTYNTDVNYSNEGGTHTYVFEYRIPLADIAYSAFGRYDAAAAAALVSSQQFYGSYFFQVAVTRTGTDNGRTQLFLSTGIPGGASIGSYFGNSAVEPSTWTREVKQFFTNTAGEGVSQSYVPSPIYHFATDDPDSVSIPAASGFRPGVSSYGYNQVDAVFKMVNSAGQYKVGDYNKYYSFTVHPAGLDNTSPAVNDTRAVPTQFRVRSGYTTKLSGTFTNDFTVGTFDASKLPSGLYTLVVTFSVQKWDGSQWVDTGTYRNLSRNITIAGSTRAANAAAQTGDSMTILLIAAAGMVVTAGAVSAVVIGKKRREMSL